MQWIILWVLNTHLQGEEVQRVSPDTLSILFANQEEFKENDKSSKKNNSPRRPKEQLSLVNESVEELKEEHKPITWAVQSPNIEGLGLEFSFVLFKFSLV